MAAEESEFGTDEGEINRPASATIAPSPYVGRKVAISVSSGRADNTTDEDRAVRPSNSKPRRCRPPIIQSDASTDISDKEPYDQTMEGASTTNMFDAASAQTNTSEGRAAIPDEDHVQRPTPEPRPAQQSLAQVRTGIAARKEELLSVEQKYLELKAATDKREEALRGKEEALRKMEVVAAAIQYRVTKFAEHVERDKSKVADLRKGKKEWEERYFGFLARWNETQGERDALLGDE
ncbi:MAG: hypothetical protein LQ349_001225 [Xanthoria aureola]|nr:MAG: hypothetical protein LQ349_001225 [Xanthoria aureola]